ncbi:GNAT family N-acetyltransferase [Pontibacillus salicampi]|uniref:GNAT family N-acetyltransferase n=1 Tax=Pontibacillus salicampi TaxID=1449801 RepID=A0ABV6LM06_9BACI
MVELVAFTEEDIDTLIQWIPSEPFLYQWGGHSFTYPLTYEQLEQYVEGANQEGAVKYIYKALDSSTGDVMGHVSIARVDWINESGRIGRVLIGDKRYLGKGYGQDIVKQATRIAFEELGLHRVSLGVFNFNVSAKKAYEKVGFVQEGTLRDARKFGEEYWTLIEMSMLREEWEQVST